MGLEKKLIVLLLCICVQIGVRADFEQCLHEPDALCFDPTCAQPVYDKHAGVPCYCTDDDLGGQFTDCDADTNTRSLVYFWRPPATCLNGTLPPPVTDIPCNLSCGIGQFINVSSVSCQNCRKGTASFGSGHKWTIWNEWPGQFTTYCSTGIVNGGCSSWRLLGDIIDSGDNYNNRYLLSVVQLRIRFITSGTISFEYRVSAETDYDGIEFVIDDLGMMFYSNKDWTNATFNIGAGYHTIKWQYYKDIDVTGGEDRAYIRSIQVSSVSYGTIDCDECPIGHYQDEEGASACKKCPADTYNDDTIGAEICNHCCAPDTSGDGTGCDNMTFLLVDLKRGTSA